MKRDSIFYKLFQQSPTLVFDLLPAPPSQADRYRFDSVSVKEPRFEIDGVLLPPDDTVGPVFFIEVQFQKDEKLYERIFAETALYFYRNSDRFSDWQVIVIYPTRSTEQLKLHPHRGLLNSEQLRRVYLNELGEPSALPLWIALMVLTTVSASNMASAARDLISRTNQAVAEEERRAIIELITTIISYQFTALNRQEVEAMLDITVEKTRIYRELREEAEKKGLQVGIELGRREEAANLVIRLLTKRFGTLAEDTRSSVASLSLKALEELSEALLDFVALSDLSAWLKQYSD
jgi:predicted transposase/invertase (TIGR01784 family)